MSGARVVFTADVTWHKGKEVRLKGVDEAVAAAPSVERMVVLRRVDGDVPMTRGRDRDWQACLAQGEARDDAHVERKANEPGLHPRHLGTTAKPMLAVHAHGGYQVHIVAVAEGVFGLRESDVWWSTSDIGWVVGHSYMVYAPLAIGCTTIAYEGALDHPDPETFYRIVERHGPRDGIREGETALSQTASALGPGADLVC